MRARTCARSAFSFAWNLNIGERHGQVHPRQSGLSGRVHIGARHAAPCDGDCLGQHDSNGGDLFNLSRPHGRSSGLDLIHTRAFQSERDGELLSNVKATPGACSPSRRVESLITILTELGIHSLQRNHRSTKALYCSREYFENADHILLGVFA